MSTFFLHLDLFFSNFMNLPDFTWLLYMSYIYNSTINTIIQLHIYTLNFTSIINNSLFISLCILRDLPQQKNPRVVCQGSSPNFICSHVPMEIFVFL